MFAWINRLDRHFPIRYCGLGAVHRRPCASAYAWARMGMSAWLALVFLFLVAGRPARPAPDAPCGAAQLPGDRPPALPARVHPAGDAPVLHRERPRGGAVLAPAALARLPARQGRVRQAAVRHPARRRRARLRVDQPLDAADRAGDARLPRHDRRRPRAAVQREHVQHLGDELRRALGQRDPGAERRRQARQLRARHRRGLDQPAPPRARRRPDLGDRLGLLRLLQRATAASARSASPPTRATRR